MTEPQRFFLDTSFWLRLVDRTDPTRRRLTRRFADWAEKRHYLLASDLVQVELREARDPERRKPALRKYLEIRKRIVPTTGRVRDIAWELIERGAVTQNHLADAFHLAYSIFGRADALVTWDVHDLARSHTRRILRDYCWRKDLPELRVGTPIEVARWLDVEIR